MGTLSALFAGTSIPAGAQFELISLSGIWNHPQPGTSYNAIIIAIGGGGGGGQSVTSASPGTNGSAGGVTTFGSIAIANGGSPSISGNGGSGGFGGGGAGASNVNGVTGANAGGNGLDFTGGGGGQFVSGATSAGGQQGASNAGPYRAEPATSSWPGWPNGGGIGSASPALGGNPLLLFPLCLGLGAGGNGGNPAGSATVIAGGGGGSGRVTIVQTTLSANQTVVIGAGGTGGVAGSGQNSGTAGQPGCVMIWYWPVRGAAEI